MKAIMRQGPRSVALVDRPIPEFNHDDVLVKVAFTGICGSDTHRLTEDIPKWDSLVLGHEFSGTIHAVGKNVEHIHIGDKVTAAPLIPCHSCSDCGRGNFSLCQKYSFIGSRIDGSFAEYVRVPAQNIVPLKADFSLEKGAFIEPITVCLHPILRLGNLLGKTAVVTGLGTIGLLAVQIFRAMGVKNVIATDIVPGKLTMARKMGATHTINGATESLEDMTRELGGADVVFESSGSNPAKQSAIRIARGRGTILLVGTSPQDISFDAALFERITRKELNIVGSWMNYSSPWPGDEWTTAAWMLEKGLIDIYPLITHCLPMHAFQDGLNSILDTQELSIKVLLEGDAS